MKDFLKKIAKKIKIPTFDLSSFLIIVCAALLGWILFGELPVFLTANEVATSVANETGKAVGLAIGSIEALTDAGETIDAAETDAAKGEITETVIKETFNDETQLEVLSTDVTIHYAYYYGGKDEEKGSDCTYAALYTMEGEGVFVVDLESMKANVMGNKVYVTLQEPDLKVSLNENTKEKISEYKATIGNFGESISSANEGYLNTKSEAVKKIKEKMAGYDGLMEASEESATNTIKSMIKAIYNLDTKVTFEGEGEVYEQ